MSRLAVILGLLLLVPAVGASLGRTTTSADLPDRRALKLLAMYEPVLLFSTAGVEELFRPSDPFEFAQRAALQQRARGSDWQTTGWNRQRLPDRASCGRPPCLRLNIGPLYGQPTPRLPTFSPSLGKLIELAYAYLPPGPRNPWARTVAFGRASSGSDCCPGWVALQYWFFYPYNAWTRDPARDDDYFQAHEGDWETVVVVLDETQTPRWAGFSQHDGGEARSWSRLTVIAYRHPVVYVARGSHANYFAPGLHPISLPLAPALARLAERFKIRVRDIAQPLPPGAQCPPFASVRGAVAGPASLKSRYQCYATMPVELLKNQHAWAGYEGLWGEDQWIGRDAAVERFRFSPGRVMGRTLWEDPIDVTFTWCRKHRDC